MPWDAIGAIGTIVAIVVSLIVWYVDYRKKHPREPKKADNGLKVTVGLAMYGSGDNVSEPQVAVGAVNPGQKRFRVESVGLQVDGTNNHVLFPYPVCSRPLPALLEETENVSCYTPIHDIASALSNAGTRGKVKVRGWFRDSYDVKHYSDKVDFDIDSFLK